MLEESVELLLGERARRPDAVIVDATFGAGGHTAAILSRSIGRVVALDADPAAVERARTMAMQYPGRLSAVHSNYAGLDGALETVGIEKVDGIVYDLGLSSIQLADETRGFSFGRAEPLDMRLDPTSDDVPAADLVNTLPERELADLIFEYGDERRSRRIAHQIVERRKRSPLRTTSDLVAAVMAARPRDAGRSAIHPATRTFQALRMAVNHELERLTKSLSIAVQLLNPGARVVTISFHSGEDRAAKNAFRTWERQGLGRALTPKPLTPGAAERAANPRSRSAKLRAAERVKEDT